MELDELLEIYMREKATKSRGKPQLARVPGAFRVPAGAYMAQGGKNARKALQTTQGKKTFPSGTTEGPYLQGPGGVWGVGYALQQDVLSTRLHPSGLLDTLPWYPSIDINPIYPYLTGYTSPTYTPPTNKCDPPSAPGEIKTCTVNYQFGRYTFRTEEFEINAVGARQNRGEFRDLRFVNDPLAPALGMDILNLSGDSALLNGREFLARMVAAGIQAQVTLYPQVYSGDPANGNGGGYAEFKGLDLSIATGIEDFLQPGTACPSLDSIVADFNKDKIEDPTADIVGLFASVMHELQNRVDLMKFKIDFENIDEFSIEMARELFWALTRIWPCSYLTNGCIDNNGSPLPYVGGAEQVAMRDAMRTGKFLWVNGLKINVILDSGVAEIAGDGNGNGIDRGCFGSTVYFTTKRVNGGFETLYMEYFDYSAQPGAIQAANDGRYFNFWSDNGIWLWTSVPSLLWCVAAATKVEPRLVNLSPMLDAKITNVQYCPDDRVSNRRAIPGQPGYVNGGVSGGRPSPFPPIAILLCDPPDGTDNVAYAGYTFTATGGDGSYTWYGNNIPPGLTLNSSTGALTGTPTDPGTYAVIVTVIDGNGLIANCQTTIIIATGIG